MASDLGQFAQNGWVKFEFDPEVAKWADAARPAALAAAQDPKHAHWLQCQGTWFVGVDVLPNDTRGHIAGQGLDGLFDRIQPLVGPMRSLHPAQVSIIYPGYPKPRETESEAAFGYRLKRDAAHVDGLRLEPESKKRVCAEYHAYVLGIPLTLASDDASPMVLWEGSHKAMGDVLRSALSAHPQAQWHDVDISEPYKAARAEVFNSHRRVELAAKPGEAYLLHRHLLHGVAPWGENVSADSAGRAIAYFRPDSGMNIQSWLQA